MDKQEHIFFSDTFSCFNIIPFSAFEMSSQLQNIKLHSKMPVAGTLWRSSQERTDRSSRWQEVGSDPSTG